VAAVTALYRHPIKGCGFEAVAAADFVVGETMPWDRVWAVAHDAAKVRPGDAGWAACVNFSRGARTAALMAVRAEVDEAAGRVALSHPARPAIAVDPDDPADAAALVAWLSPLHDPARVQPAFVVRAGRGMTDSAFPSVAILNEASLGALGDRFGRPLERERFRGNVWLEGLAPFGEFDLVGREIRVGGATLAVRERITRCVATSVNPATGASDADTLAELQAGWGHKDFGVYAEVVGGGRVAVGDRAAL
jgi:uncharacterized protein YcbX